MPTPRTNRSTPQPICALLVVALVLAAFVVEVGHHALRNYQLDFRAYYAAGRAVNVGVDPYDLGAVRAAVSLPGEQLIIGYLYPPPTLWLSAAFAHLPYPLAQLPWLLLQFAAVLTAAWLALRWSGATLATPAAVALAVLVVAGQPTLALLNWGQFDGLVVLPVMLSIVLLTRHQALAGGVWLGLAAVAKVTPLFYLGVLLVAGRRRALAAAGATVAALIGVSLLWPGPAALGSWWGALRDFSGDTASILAPGNMSLRGMLYRWFVDAQTHQGGNVPLVSLPPALVSNLTDAVCGGLVLLTLAALWRARRRVDAGTALALTIPLVLLITPITWSHHCVTMLPTLALFIGRVVVRPAARGAQVAFVLISVAWLVGGGSQLVSGSQPLLNHLVVPTLTYGLLVSWGWSVWLLVQARATLTSPAATTATIDAPTPAPPATLPLGLVRDA